PDYGLGRNCTLFEKLRQWAYKAIRQGWPDADRWYEAVLTRARAYNDFDAPLPDSEVKATARSVAKWTHCNLSSSGFSQWQAAQGRKGGVRSGQVRRQGSAVEREPWACMGISRATYYRRKKSGEI
uniref:primase C-terminal domain-containing protein n=1 Tax=Halomonas hibernica TaxID=2591147 RepID=UPI001555E025